jgi:ABC-2 type transport system permease protein
VAPLKKTLASLSASLPAVFDRLLGNVSLATPAGWMNAEMMLLVAPGFLIATAILSGGTATAGDEQARTMGLVLSTSTSRITFLAAKTAAMVVYVLIVSAAMFIGLVVGNMIGQMGIGVGLLLAATGQASLVGLVFGAIALSIGAAGADRRRTMTISAGIAGVSFVLAVILPMNESLAGLAKLNFWYPYSANPALVHGIDGGGLQRSWPPARSSSPRSVSSSSPAATCAADRTTRANASTCRCPLHPEATSGTLDVVSKWA